MTNIIIVDFHKLPDVIQYYRYEPKDLVTLKSIEKVMKAAVVPGEYICIQWTVTDTDHFFVAVNDTFELLQLMEYV